MKNLTIALMATAAFTSVGCKKKGGGGGEAMAKMSEFKDKMCACKDSKCATGVQEEMTKWSQEMAKSAGDKKPEPMSEEDTKKYTEATTAMADCAQKAMSAGGDMAGSGSAAATPRAGSGSAAPAADAPKVGEGPVVPSKTLARWDPPGFKGVPESALWTGVEAEKDGHKWTHLKDGDKLTVSLRIIDCNHPDLKNKWEKETERADFKWCFMAPAADAPKAGEWPRLDKAGDNQRVIKVGHLIVIAGTADDKIKLDDIATWLGTIDFKPLLDAAK